MASKKFIGVATAAAVALGAYWYWSPFVSLHQLKASVHARDAQAFNSLIDYPKLRENLKGHIAAKMTATLAKEARAGGKNAALGTQLALGLSGSVIDAMVRPEMVEQAMKSGTPGQVPGPGVKNAPGAEMDSMDWSTEREGLNRIVVNVKSNPAALATPGGLPKQGSLVLEREGFATWKVVGVRIPLTD